MSARGHALRVAIVMGSIIEEQTTVWAACSDLGADVTIIGTDFNPYKGWPWQPGATERVNCVLLRPMSPSLKRGQQLWTYRGLARTLRQVSPDLIHVESEPWGGLALQSILDAKVLRLGTRLCVHGADSIYWHGSRLEQMLRRMVLHVSLKQLDAFVSRNKAGLRLASEAGLKPSTPTRIMPAVVPDPAVFAPATAEQRGEIRKRLGLPLDGLIVAYIGRLVEEKGVRDLVQALKIASAPQPFFAVWGVGPLSRFVEQEFQTGAIRGYFGGGLSRADVAEALRAVDIVVVPSRTTEGWREHFGRVVLESMFCGTAVVAYASGAIPEVIEEGGVLVPEGDVEKLGRAIDQLAKDESLRLDLARRGHQHALARFHPTSVARDLIDFWSKVVAGEALEDAAGSTDATRP